MDFGVSSVFKLIGQGISLAKAIWKMISSFKELQKGNREMQRQVGVLKSVLESINQVDTLQDPSVAKELHKSLNNLHVIMNEATELLASLNFEEAMAALKSFEGSKDEKFLKRLRRKLKEAKEVGELIFMAESKANILILLDKRLKLALSIVQIGFSCTQVRQIRRIGVRLTAEFHDLNFMTDDTQEVYTDPGGDVPSDSVTNVEAKVSSQRLIIKWDSSGRPEGTKYEIKYHDTKHLTVICDGSPVALGSQRVQPWKNYSIQVRAVNSAGASPWSYPPVYVRMNEGAPSCPSFLIVDMITSRSFMVSAEKPPKEQCVTHVIVEKCKKWSDNDILQWHSEEHEVNDDNNYVIRGLTFTMGYLIRIRYRNRFDVSQPSAPVAVRIEDMLPNQPTDFELIPRTIFSRSPKIQFRPPSVNRGAVHKYEIEITESISKSKVFMSEIQGDTEPEGESGLLSLPLVDMPFNIRDPSTSYDMIVRAVAKKGKTTGTGRLVIPATEELGNLEPRVHVVGPTVLPLKVDKPSFSTEFTDSDVY
jgi:hypothetical protein